MSFQTTYAQQQQKQRTLRSSFSCTGIGLHTGYTMTLHAKEAPVDQGIRFYRTDVASEASEIRALWNNVVHTKFCTGLRNAHNIKIQTIEHLMAALQSSGIDNVRIEIDGPEIPIMDGCCEHFMGILDNVGSQEQASDRQVLRILKPIMVGNQTSWAKLTPSQQSIYDFTFLYPEQEKRERRCLVLSQQTFKEELSMARTFCFVKDIPYLRQAGFIKGGSKENALVFDQDRVLNPGGKRFEDECVRHKLLDSIGDMYLSGGQILGCYEGYKAGHTLNHQLLCSLFADKKAWQWETVSVS